MTETQYALKVVEGGDAVVVKGVPIPKVKGGFILAETRALCLNPTDWKHMKELTVPGSTLGCDWSGVVLEVGNGVTRFKPGDEVWGVCHGGNNTHFDYGAFAQRIICVESATCHKPANLSFEQAATLGVGTLTCGQVLYFLGGLPEPLEENLSKKPSKDILIYGASSGTGTLAVQLAKLSGYRVLATCSPSNFSTLVERGADLVYDYHDPQSIEAIKSEVGDNLSYIVDCIGNDSCVEYCAQLLSSRGGHYHSVPFPLRPKFKELRPEDSVKGTSAAGYTMLGQPFKFENGLKFDVDPKEVEFAKKWAGTVDRLLKGGLLKPHPVDIRDGGLEGVLKGLYELHETGGPSGKKMVYPMTL